MPQLLHPGVYIQEVPSTTRAIEGASTSAASFIGLADRGPIYKAVAVSSFSDYQLKFCWNNGGFRADSYLSYAVRAFFDNGGKKCYIVGVTKTDDQKKIDWLCREFNLKIIQRPPLARKMLSIGIK